MSEVRTNINTIPTCDFFLQDKGTVRIYNPRIKKTIEISAKILRNPFMWKIREFFGFQGGYCKLKTQNGSRILVKVEELAEVLKLSADVIVKLSRNDELTRAIVARNEANRTGVERPVISLSEQSFIERSREATQLIKKGELVEAFEICEELYVEGANPRYYESILNQFNFKPGEWLFISRQEPIVKDTLFGSDVKFTPFEFAVLKNFIRDNNFQNNTSIQQFFSHIYQNREFNARIGRLLVFMRSVGREDSDEYCTLNEFYIFSHKSHMFGRFRQILKKIENLSKKLKHKKITQPEKLTFKELRLIQSVSKENMSSLLNDLEFLGFNSSFCASMVDDIDRTRNFLSELEKILDSKSPIQSGDILFNSILRQYDETDLEWNPYCLFIKDYDHVGLGLKHDSSDNNSAHFNFDGYSTYRKSLVDKLMHDKLRLSFRKMITPYGWTLLRKKYPHMTEDEILKEIQAQFDLIAGSTLLGSGAFNHIKVTHTEQVKSLFVSKKVAPREELDVRAFRRTQYSYCSALAGRVVGVMISALETSLRTDLSDTDWVKGRFVLKNPFLDKNFTALTPDRLYEVLQEVAEPQKIPSIIKDIVAFDS